MPQYNRQSSFLHTHQRYEFAEPYGRNNHLVSDNLVPCIELLDLVQSCQ